MKAVLLIIQLKRDVQHCREDVSFLESKFRNQFEKVIHSTRTIGYLMPNRDILAAMRAPIANALSVFENYHFIGLSGEALAMNGGLDPLVSSLKQYVVPPVQKSRGLRMKPDNDQHPSPSRPFAMRRQPRRPTDGL